MLLRAASRKEQLQLSWQKKWQAADRPTAERGDKNGEAKSSRWWAKSFSLAAALCYNVTIKLIQDQTT